jgi:hypothetical protein
MRIPIACTLTVDDAATRLDEWRSMVTRLVATIERPAPTELVLLLRDDARSELSMLVDLVQREATCCAFFQFALHIGSDAVSLRMTVPPDAIVVLDNFAQLAR